MDPDQATARALGFPEPAYTAIERERRWLCRDVPWPLVVRGERITDLYVDGARLRLRRARPLDGRPDKMRLTRKQDVDPRTRLVTSIYLSAAEFDLLEAALSGRRLEKTRYRLRSEPGVLLSLDRFAGPLDGLVLLEADFATAEAMAAFTPPAFAQAEVTDDAAYTGIALAVQGPPVSKSS